MFFEHKTPVAEDIFRLKFSHEGFRFALSIAGINWLRRHFEISSRDWNKTRFYSLCLCLHDEIQQKINLLLSNITILENKGKIISPKLNDNEYYEKIISFYVKDYDIPEGLSYCLNNLPAGTSSSVNIRGPIVSYENNYFLLQKFFNFCCCFIKYILRALD